MRTAHRWTWGLLVGSVLVGCGSSPEELPGTGAKECAHGYFEALIQRDWPKAYALLESKSQKRCSSQQFSRLAQSYRDHLGFEPETVQVRINANHSA